MLLKNLINNISGDKKNIFISGLAINSQEVKKNYIFFAIKGNKINGEKFIPQAIQKGASVIVCSKSCKINDKKILIIRTNKIRNFLSNLASKFYPLKPKNILAVTGTNGKTSVADIFYQMLRINNIPAATIGTLGVKYNGKTIKTNLTSPDTISLHKYLFFLKKRKIDNVIIEASSHGLDQKRMHHIKFKGGIFTNFTQDHLDYHKTMRSYLDAKLILFKEILGKKATIISDKEIQPFSKLNLIAKEKNLKIIDIAKQLETIKNCSNDFTINYKIKNLAMALQAVKLCGFKEKLIIRSLNKIKDVNGRLEFVKKFKNNVKVFIDYAHTPDALFQTLKSLKKLFGNNISLVFGCGGERDKKKRPIMAKIANDNCKKIYITDDNPRNENPNKIRSQLLKYITKKNRVFNIGKRDLAIKKAIQNANPDEIILVAGKGHEEQQFYKNKILNISDKRIIKSINFKNKSISHKKLNYLQNNSILKKIIKKSKSFKFNGLSIDTRLIKKENLFLAIKGKNNDGNKFLSKAFKKGAAYAITEKKTKKNRKIIRIKNTILFLNSFAKLKRELTSANIIAITGSTGKTSLKNVIKDLLKYFGSTHASPKSFNNHFGVPLSLSNLNYKDKFGVFEVGMSKYGEIRNLTKMIKPHIGIITNIGEAHIENFKNINGIAKAKSEIIENIETGGTIILNRDDKFFNYLSQKAKKYKLNISSFGHHKDSDIRIDKIINLGKKSKVFISIKGTVISFNIVDINIYNVLAALALLKELNLNFYKILSKFKNFSSLEGRGKKYNISRYNKKFRFIDESYNANPSSVKTAINNLRLIKKHKFKKYLILGDMLELGSKSKKFHEELSKVINNSDIDKVFIKGNKTLFTYKHINREKRGNIFQNNEDIDFSLNKMISNNDYLMIKGSNATGLNNFSKKLIKGI